MNDAQIIPAVVAAVCAFTLFRDWWSWGGFLSFVAFQNCIGRGERAVVWIAIRIVVLILAMVFAGSLAVALLSGLAGIALYFAIATVAIVGAAVKAYFAWLNSFHPSAGAAFVAITVGIISIILGELT